MANEFKIKKGLIVDGTNTVLDIQGTQGQLFSVTDSLTGDLFSVSDISGIPILNVNSTGLVTVDGNLYLPDNKKILLGTGNDLQIYHDGSNSYITDIGAGDLRVGTGAFRLLSANLGETMMTAFEDGAVNLYHNNALKLATTSTGVTVTGKTTTGTAHFDGAANSSGTGAEIGRNHAYDTLELKGYGNEMMIGSQGTDLHINYRTCNNNTSSHTPNRWFWRAGSSTSYSDHYFGEVFSDGLITWNQGNSSHLGTGAAVTTYVGNSSVNNAAIKSNSNTEDMWIMNWGDSAAWGIYNRNIDSSLAVTNAITIPANSTSFIGSGLARTYINHANGNIGTLGTVEADKLKILGGAGYFFNDSGTRTAFTGGDLYIQSIGTYYNYAGTQYHGNSSGDNHYFRGNPLTGNNWSIDAAGKIMGTDLTFGNSPGASGTGRLIIQNDTSGNQGTAGYGILKQRDVNKQVVAGQNTHTAGYIWYTIKIPSGYSNSGLGSDVEVVIRTGGRHHNGKTLQKYIISVGNGSTANIGNFNGINILQTLDSRIAGSYGGNATSAEFYYRTSVANDTGEVILRLLRADREPVTVVEINPQGAWNNDITKTPSLVCHGLGTTYDSQTNKGQINETRPTANLSTALVIQKAGFTQTTGTNGKLDVSANGPASGTSHEIARFVNMGSLATSSYMYIGASSGTDWRLGKNIMGTSGNNNFGIAKHSGTTLALEIDGSDNATFAADLTAGSSGKFQVLGAGYIQLGNCTIGASGDNNHIHVNCPTALIPNSTTLADNTALGTSSYRWKTFHAGPGNFLGSVTASADVVAYSDIKLKENIKTLDGSKVLQMRGVSFDRKDNGASSSGVIAQEMQKVAPELVSDDDGTLGVAYGNITGYLIEAIKEQQKQIDELKKLIKNGNNL
mgnify:FL=1|tara:strand:+ start:3011 stop:5716 length:2706 start_codon:yes stop_codon:yes gene_type:complete